MSSADRRRPARRLCEWLLPLVLFQCAYVMCPAQSAQSVQAPPAKTAATPQTAAAQLVDITAHTGIHFSHMSTPDARYIVESMSGGVALIDYDQDGYPDIYFTNAASVEMGLAGKKAKGTLYRNNHDGTFTDVTDKAGVGFPCRSGRPSAITTMMAVPICW
jgi:hypothetical protein